MRTSIDSHIFETGTPRSTARCCTRLTEFPDSTSSVMLAMPVIIRSPCSQRGGTEICRFTSLLSRSSAVPIHWQNCFCARRGKTTNSVALFAELSSMVSPRRPSFQIPRLATWTAVALDCASITSPCLIQGMESNILAGTDSGSPSRDGHASNECHMSVKSTPPAMKANRVRLGL